MSDCPQLRDQFKQNLAVDILRNVGFVRMAARGYSMLPTLWPGDVVTIQAQALEQIQVGDVVLFARDGRLFIHRVLRKVQLGSQSLLTRGDAMPDADAPVSAAELLGKIVRVQRDSHPGPQVPACSVARRWVGLAFAYSATLRGLALRWHTRRSPAPTEPEFAAEQASMI